MSVAARNSQESQSPTVCDPELREWESAGVPGLAVERLIQGRPAAAIRALPASLRRSDVRSECFYYLCHLRGGGAWAPGIDRKIDDDRRLPGWLASTFAAERALVFGDDRAAERAVLRGLKGAPGSPNLRRLRAQILIRCGRRAEAIEDLERLIANGVNSAVTLRARAARCAGQAGVAEELLTEFLQRNPSSIAAHDEIAMLFLSIGDFALAAEHIVVARGIENGVPLASVRMLRASLTKEPILRGVLSSWLIASSIPLVGLTKYGIGFAYAIDLVGHYVDVLHRTAAAAKWVILVCVGVRVLCDAFFLSIFHLLKRPQLPTYPPLRRASAAFLALVLVTGLVVSSESFTDYLSHPHLIDFTLVTALVLMSTLFLGAVDVALAFASLAATALSMCVLWSLALGTAHTEGGFLTAYLAALCVTAVIARPIIRARRIDFRGAATKARRGIPANWVRSGTDAPRRSS